MGGSRGSACRIRPGYYILHEGLIGVFGDEGLQEIKYSDPRRRQGDRLDAGRPRLARHHRQVLGDGADPGDRIAHSTPASSASTSPALLYQADFRGEPLIVPAGGTAETSNRLFAGAKQVVGRRRLSEHARHQEVRTADRLGLVLFHHQAAVPCDRLVLPARRQFRRGDPRRHRAHQAHLLPARQQVLQVDEHDEEGPAEDDWSCASATRTTGEAAAGADGALQDREDQSGRRLLADADPGAGVLRALQGALRHDRNAACAVLRLDQGSRGAGPDVDLQPVRADPVGSAASS